MEVFEIIQEVIVENRKQNELYFDLEEENEIPINVDVIPLGNVQSIFGTEIKTNGVVDLLVNLKPNSAVKFKNTDTNKVEIRRVESILTDDTFLINYELLHEQTGIELETDFVANNYTEYKNVFKNGILTTDNFENSLQIGDVSTGIFILSKCTVFDNLDSIFLYDNAENIIDRQESLVLGTYDLTTGDEQNVYNPLIIKTNRVVNYIINMKESIEDLDDEYKVTISGLQDYIYSLYVNGMLATPEQYDIFGNTIEITDSSLLNPTNNYIRVLSFPNQLSFNTHKIRFKFNNYDNNFILDRDYLELLRSFKWRGELTSQANPDFYAYNNRVTKQTERLKMNQNNKITFEVKTGLDGENIKNITESLKLYLKDREFFRLISYNEKLNKYDYYVGCRLLDGINFSEDLHYNRISYSIDYLKKYTIGQHTWGDEGFKWGDFMWGLVGYSHD